MGSTGSCSWPKHTSQKPCVFAIMREGLQHGKAQVMLGAKRLSCEAPEATSAGVSIIAMDGFRPGSQAPVALFEFTIDPYVSSEIGANPVTEVMRILSGTGIVRSGSQELTVQAGDWVLVEPNVKHQVLNAGGDVLRALSISWVGRPAV